MSATMDSAFITGVALDEVGVFAGVGEGELVDEFLGELENLPLSFLPKAESLLLSVTKSMGSREGR